MHKLLAVSALLAIAGCADVSAPETPTMSGPWIGTVGGTTIRAVMTEDKNVVTGSGHVAFGAQTVAMAVTGTHVYPNVSLTMRVPGFQDLNYMGRFTSPNTIQGRANGSGFNGDQLQMLRRSRRAPTRTTALP